MACRVCLCITTLRGFPFWREICDCPWASAWHTAMLAVGAPGTMHWVLAKSVRVPAVPMTEWVAGTWPQRLAAGEGRQPQLHPGELALGSWHPAPCGTGQGFPLCWLPGSVQRTTRQGLKHQKRPLSWSGVEIRYHSVGREGRGGACSGPLPAAGRLSCLFACRCLTPISASLFTWRFLGVSVSQSSLFLKTSVMAPLV